MEWLILAAFVSLIGTLYGTWEEDARHQQDLVAQKELLEDSQSFTTSEREAQNAHDLKVHQSSLLEDPLLMMQGFENAGISRAAAAQAVLGSSSSFQPQVASNASIAAPSVPSRQSITPLFEAIGNIGNGLFDNSLKAASTESKRSEIPLNAARIDEIKSNIVKSGHDMQVDDANIEIAKKLADLEVMKTPTEIQNMVSQAEKAAAEAQKTLAEIPNVEKQGALLDAETAKAHAEASLSAAKTVTETEFVQPNIAAQTGLTQSQTKNQDILNWFGNLRVRYSQILGVDATADVVTQLVEATATGKINTALNLFTSNAAINPPSLYQQASAGAYQTALHKLSKRNRYKGSDHSHRSMWNPIH